MSWKKALFFISLFLILTPRFPVESNEPSIELYFFWGMGCSHCENQKVFLAELAEEYPELVIRDFEVYRNRKNQELFQKMAAAYQVNVRGIPITFIGDKVITGFEGVRTTGRDIKNIVENCLIQECPSPLERISGDQALPIEKGDSALDDTLFELSLFGRDIGISAESSLPWLAIGLGLIDGINPCTLSVLFFLLTYLLAIGSRRKAVKTGLIFALTVFAIYLMFMLGILNLITLIGVVYRIKIFVAIIVLVAGLIMLKDFFYYGRWISLEIPNKTKPAIKKLIQKGTIPSAIILGALASLVEIPCSAGIPLAYTIVLAQQQISGLAALPYLVAYNFFYIVPMLIIIGLVAFVLLKVDQAEAWRLKFRKYMRLVSGIILLFLGISLLMGWM